MSTYDRARLGLHWVRNRCGEFRTGGRRGGRRLAVRAHGCMLLLDVRRRDGRRRGRSRSPAMMPLINMHVRVRGGCITAALHEIIFSRYDGTSAVRLDAA